MRAAVIGSGMSGSVAAFSLQAQGCDVVVFERGEIGGRTRICDLDGVKVDVGAQFLTSFYVETLALLKSSGSASDLRKISPSIGVFLDGRIRDLLGWRAVLGGDVLPWSAKVAVIPEVLLALVNWRSLSVQALWRSADLDTDSLSDAYARSEGSRLLLERLVAPAIDNFLYWDPTETSRALSPALVKGALILRRMWTLQEGVGSLPAILLAGIPVIAGSPVVSVREEKSAVWVQVADGREEQFDGVVVATPATSVPSLWSEAPKAVQDFVSAVNYSKTTVVSARVHRRVASPTHGVMFPGGRDKLVAAVTVASRRGSPELPPGDDILQVFSTENAARKWQDMSDQDILESVGRALERIGDGALDPRRDIGALNVCRWDEALPKFRPGYLRLLRDLQPWLESPGRVKIAGDYLSGPFIEGAVATGKVAADALLKELGNADLA
ncbi:FAD-dependent oxidoreductase [Streptomyces sp. NPDC052727]|uniref:protoporphyrinogen/coproporphyrinogen oxidase n=1 Tax=Streptomyces sp. NPDC052727 TaxID=3154854 RepID=UPI0034478B8C